MVVDFRPQTYHMHMFLQTFFFCWEGHVAFCTQEEGKKIDSNSFSKKKIDSNVDARLGLSKPDKLSLVCVFWWWCIAARGGVRVGGPVLRRQGEPERVAGAGGVAGGVQPLTDLGHLRRLRQRPQHHRGWLAGLSSVFFLVLPLF